MNEQHWGIIYFLLLFIITVVGCTDVYIYGDGANNVDISSGEMHTGSANEIDAEIDDEDITD